MKTFREVHLYDASNIHLLDWPTHEDGNYAKKFLVPLVKHGTRKYINNIDVDMQVLKCGDLILPITVIDGKYQISHVCSPYDHYISHALESMHFIGNSVLNPLMKGATHGLGLMLKLGNINKVINVNNWLFATDLYPRELTKEVIESIITFLTIKFPEHAIIFRSINPLTNKETLEALKTQNAHLIISRQVHLTDTRKEEIFRTRILKSDQKLLRESQYQIIDGDQLEEEDFPKIVALYKQLYLEKYSYLSPDLNSDYLKLLVNEKLLTIKTLKKDGVLFGVVGYFHRNGIATSPFFGYDQAKSQHSDLYRLLSTILLLETKERGMILHQGAGASFYKKLRRAESTLEYMAIYHQHLPIHRRASWKLLGEIMNRVAVKLVQKY